MTLLHPERERAGDAYEELRRILIRFFRWRGGRVAEELADETLQRVAVKCTEGESIANIRGFTLGVARLVLLEEYKNRQREHDALGQWQRESPRIGQAEDVDEREVCLQRCLAALADEERELVLAYYSHGESSKSESRRALARVAGLTVNALRIRAHRLRERLESCIRSCLKDDVK